MNRGYIKLKNVFYKYAKTDFSLMVKSLSFNLGEITAIVGENASGKSTLSKLMIGILKADDGSIFICDENIENLKLHEIGQKVGYLFQNVDRQLFCTTVFDEIIFSLKHNGMSEDKSNKIANRLIQEFSMEHLKDKYPLHCSRGEKQRLALICLLAISPDFFLLDEPTSGVDDANKELIISIIKQLANQGKGVCIITHDDKVNCVADRKIILEHGRVVGS